MVSHVSELHTLKALSQHHGRTICRRLHLTSVFAAVSEQAPWEILFAAQIIPWSTSCSEFAEKETHLGHFANFLNVGCVRHLSTKAVLSSSLMSYVC